MSNVKVIIVSKMTSHCVGAVQMREKSESEKRCDLRRQQKMERGGSSLVCTVVHRAVKNLTALKTVDTV